jgi:hypothetical protein
MTAAGAYGCEVIHEPLPEIVAALGVVGADGRDPFGARYPRALGTAAEQLVAAAVPAEAAAGLAGEVFGLGVDRVIGSVITRELTDRVDAPAMDLVDRIAAVARLGEVAAPPEGTAERLTALHTDSGFDRVPILPAGQQVRIWPVRLLPPAPAGKLFARNTPSGAPLRLAFGDIGQVGTARPNDWLQWYRLGIWHACLNKQWAGAVHAAGTPALEAAFAAIPLEHRQKTGVHESAVHTFASWSSYFLDNLVSAGKVVLEGRYIDPIKGAGQQRWLRSLGRVHLDWFVDQLDADLTVDVPGLATAWLADIDVLAKTEVSFRGPLAACESPPWSAEVDVLFSPSIPRMARRSMSLWLRGNWPGEVTLAETGLTRSPVRPRLVYAMAEDAEWLATLAGAIAPDTRAAWHTMTQDKALMYAYRHASSPRMWTRVCVGSSADAMAHLQQMRPPFAGWARVDAGETITSGTVDQPADGWVRLGPADPAG